MTRTDEYTEHLVFGLTKYTSITGCNVSMDRYFTSIRLAHWAYEKGFTVVSTLRQDRKRIQKEIKAMENRDDKSTMYLYETKGDVMLVSYLDKKNSGKKYITVLSTKRINGKSQMYIRFMITPKVMLMSLIKFHRAKPLKSSQNDGQ